MSYSTREKANAYAREWYHNRGGKDSIRKAKHRYQKKVRAFVVAAKDQPCKDCGNRYPPECMDFDHIRKKDFGIGLRGNRSLPQVKAEIAKCEVVCANCHRIRTRVRSDKRGVLRDGPILS